MPDRPKIMMVGYSKFYDISDFFKWTAFYLGLISAQSRRDNVDICCDLKWDYLKLARCAD